MKTKIITMVLAATVSLGACSASRENSYVAADHHRSAYAVHGEQLSRRDVRKVQRSLTREGFYKGPIDGIWGTDTSQAILDYQTARHPEQTDVTVDTLQEFGVRMDKDHYASHHRKG
jgi:hypothetical protein